MIALSARHIALAFASAFGLLALLHLADRVCAGITAAQAGLLP